MQNAGRSARIWEGKDRAASPPLASGLNHAGSGKGASRGETPFLTHPNLLE